MPFRILQVIPDAIFTHTRTTVNKLYEENNQKKDPAQKKSDFSELPRELVELDVIAEDLMTVDQTVISIAPPSF